MSWTRIGTVSVTNNSNAVIGTGTGFISSSRVGDAFIGPDGALYEVTNIASDTALSIAPNYKGPTVAAGGYALAPIQGYVKDTADALRAASGQIADSLGDLDESVEAAAGSASAALVSKNAAAQSETNAGQSAAASLASKNAAGTSETNAGQSAAAALASKNAAGTSETNAANSAAAALASKNAAAISEQNTANKAAKGANNDITSLSGLTTALSLAQGGTGVTSVAAQLSALLTAGAYGKSNILGTVSQTSGVPTGAIIESGSNANGNYIKYADGTLRCTRIVNVGTINVTTPNGGTYYAGPIGPYTFAQAFVGLPVVQVGIYCQGGIAFGGAGNGLPTSTQTGPIFVQTGSSFTVTITLHITADGRWF